MNSEDDEEEDWLSVLEDAAEVAAAHEDPSRTTPACEDRARFESEAQLAGSSVGEEEHGEGKKWQARMRVRTAAANGDGRTMLGAGPRTAAPRREGRHPVVVPRRRRARLARIPANVQDADDILAKREDERYAAMVAAGTHSAEEIATLRLRKRHMEEVQVCRMLMKTKAWETDSSCSRRNVFLCLAVRTHSAVDEALVLRGARVFVQGVSSLTVVNLSVNAARINDCWYGWCGYGSRLIPKRLR